MVQFNKDSPVDILSKEEESFDDLSPPLVDHLSDCNIPEQNMRS